MDLGTEPTASAISLTLVSPLRAPRAASPTLSAGPSRARATPASRTRRFPRQGSCVTRRWHTWGRAGQLNSSRKNIISFAHWGERFHQRRLGGSGVMGVAAWERERDAQGGGLGLARPLVSHRGSYLPPRGLSLDTTPLGRDLLPRRLPRPVSARPAGDSAVLRGRPPSPVLPAAIGRVTSSSGTGH